MPRTFAFLGGVVWLLTPFFGPPLGSLAHGFLLLPLVAMPLAFELLAELTGHRFARGLVPLAAFFVLLSFTRPPGLLAGLLVVPWILLALLVAIGDARHLAPRSRPHFSGVNLVAAHVLFPLATVWLLISRLGVAPPGFTAERVFLAMLHFHFSGFLLQLLIVATARQLPPTSRLAPVQKALSPAAVAGFMAMVASNALALPPLRFAGVLAVVAATLALAVTTVRVARSGWLLLSAGSLLAAMLLALVHGIGERAGQVWLAVPTMVALHGYLNGLGFVLPGLAGHLAQRTSR